MCDVFMDGCVREMKAKVGNVGTRLKVNEVDWFVVACLFVADTVLLLESERELQRVVDKFYSVCVRKKLRVNVGKSEVIVFERKEVEVVDFKVSVPVAGRCEVDSGGEGMEEVKWGQCYANIERWMEKQERESCES